MTTITKRLRRLLPGNGTDVTADDNFLHALVVGGITLLGFLTWQGSKSLALMARRGAAKVARVVSYLVRAEYKEPEERYHWDIRLARMIVASAFRGVENPYFHNFCRMYGKSPEKAIPIWQEREQELLTFASLPPKKTPEPVKVLAKKAGTGQ